MSTFRRVYGPDETTMFADAVFEMSNYYKGTPTPTGRTPHVEITYYVLHHDVYPTDPEQDAWSVECCCRSWLSPEGSDEMQDENYDYEGGSDLWYWTEESAIAACRDNFAHWDEAWKLDGWDPA